MAIVLGLVSCSWRGDAVREPNEGLARLRSVLFAPPHARSAVALILSSSCLACLIDAPSLATSIRIAREHGLEVVVLMSDASQASEAILARLDIPTRVLVDAKLLAELQNTIGSATPQALFLGREEQGFLVAIGSRAIHDTLDNVVQRRRGVRMMGSPTKVSIGD